MKDVNLKYQQPTQMCIFQLFELQPQISYYCAMIEIRKKKEQQRQTIRREFLDNYFREMRKNCFKFGNAKQENQNMEIQTRLLDFLCQSLKQNCLAQRLRDSRLLQQLQELAGQAVKAQNLFEVKLLLTIISNTLKDDLEVDEKSALFQLSATLFQSLNLSHFDRQNKDQRDQFEKVVKNLHPETLVFYMSTANQTNSFLDEQDQIRIQLQIYPAFANIFMHTLSHPQEITNLEEFQSDMERFFKSVFDPKDAFYEQGNRMKAERLMPFYEEIFKGHLWLLENNEQFGQFFAGTQIILFRSYLKLTQIIGDFPQFLVGKDIFRIMEFTFRKSWRKEKQIKLNFIYSILQIFLDRKLLLPEVEAALLTRDHQTNVMNFQRAINLVMCKSQVRYRALEMIEAVLALLFQDNLFRDLVENYEIQLVDMCAQIMSRFHQQMMGESRQRKLVFRALTILRILVEKENVEGKKNVSLVKRFESHSGQKSLECISEWFHDADVGEDMEIAYSLNYIEEILLAIDVDIEVQPMSF